MLKISMNVIKYKKANTSDRLMGFQIFEKLERMRIFEKIPKNIEISNFIEDEDKKIYGMEMHSTSPPCGNLVDGLPHDCHNDS